MSGKYTLEQLFNEAPIGFEESFRLIENGVFQKQRFDELRQMLVAKNYRLTARCLECGREYAFIYRIKPIVDDVRIDMVTPNIVFARNDTLKCSTSRRNLFSKTYGLKVFDGEGVYTESDLTEEAPSSDMMLLKEERKYLFYQFTCTSDPTHHCQMILSVLSNNGTVTVKKIGQNPQPDELGTGSFSEYGALLEKMGAKNDSLNSDRSYHNGLYVASLTYLRRIFEKTIDYLDGGKDKKSRMNERLKAIKDKIDPEIYDVMNGAWKYVSENVHSKTEEEAKNNYECVETILSTQFSYMKAKAEQEKRQKAAKEVIHRFMQGKN